jgi:hypothetical protein
MQHGARPQPNRLAFLAGPHQVHEMSLEQEHARSVVSHDAEVNPESRLSVSAKAVF